MPVLILSITPLAPSFVFCSAIHGAEPDFTNNAVNINNAFIGTLDYIFLANAAKPLQAVKLPHRNAIRDGPYPSDTEPSDHVLIWSDVALGKK